MTIKDMRNPKSEIRTHSSATRLDVLKFTRCVSLLRPGESDIRWIANFLNKDIPWEELIEVAEREGVTGLLFHHLKQPGIVNPPPKAILDHLEAIDLQTTGTTLSMIAELRRLSDWLARAHIPAIVLQGMSLIELYRDPGLRPMGDMDLMVRAIHKPRLRELLLEAGYCTATEVYPDVFYRDGICIDIHSHVLNLERIGSRRYVFPEDIEPLWERARSYFGWTESLMVLDPFDNFVALAAHALKHSYSRLIWLADLFELSIHLTSQFSEGWGKIVEHTRFWKQQKVVLYALLLLEGIFESNVPEWVYAELGIRNLSPTEKYLIGRKIKGFSSERYGSALWLFVIPNVRDKMKFIQEALFPRDEIMAQIFPENRGKERKKSLARRMVQAGGLLWDDLRKVCSLSS